MNLKIFFLSLSVICLLFSVAHAQECDPALRAQHGGTCPTGPVGTGAMQPDIPPNPVYDNPEKCTAYDLRTTMQLSSMPVRNQGGLGICYAEAAAQMMDFWRMGRRGRDVNHHTSALAAAILLREHSMFSPFRGNILEVNGGYICDAYESMRDNGSCERGRLHGRRTRDGRPFDMDRLMTDVAAIVRQYRAVREATGFSIFDGPVTIAAMTSVRGRFLREVTTEVIQCFNHHLGSNIPTNLATIVRVGVYVERERVNDLYADMVNAMCEGSATEDVEDAPECDTHLADTGPEMFNKLLTHTRAGSNNIVGINFCSAFFSQGRTYRGVQRPGTRVVNEETCGAHAVVVVGRRMNPTTNKCQILLRNSWGAAPPSGGCDFYLSSEYQCENGHVWVDAEVLMENSWSINTIQ